MSLLLEALKKAAEEKQRQQARSEHQPSTEVEEDSGGFTFVLDEPGADLGDAGPSGDTPAAERPRSALRLQDEAPQVDQPEETLESLLSDGQTASQLDEMPEPVAPALTATDEPADDDGSFSLSLLDDAEIERELAADRPEPALSTVEALIEPDEADSEPFPVEEASPVGEFQPEAAAVAPDTDKPDVEAAAVEALADPAPVQALQTEVPTAAAPEVPEQPGEEVAVTEPPLRAKETARPAGFDQSTRPVADRIEKSRIEQNRVAPDRVAPDRVAPDRVLKAIERTKRRRTILLLALGWLTVLAAGGWGYLSYLEQSEDSSRIMARYRPPVAKPVPAEESGGQLQSELQAALSDEETVAALEAQLELLSNFVGEDAVASVKPLLDQRLEADVEASAGESAGAAETDTPAAAAVPPPAELPAAPPVDAAVKVTRRIVPSGSAGTLDIQRRSEDSAVLRAYRAFQQGDLAQAGRLYQQVLKQQPRNRDAVVGLAAVAAAQRQYQEAADYYRLLLEYDPSDRQAFEGLIALPGQAYDPVELESKLKVFLSRFPDSARAQQALGQLMAGQQRWYEAQQAYFNAYTADKSNANYALNLAVSLDHLRKYPQALQYYRTALQLAGERTAIDRQAIQKRIETLEKTGR
ncbi:tetratricopeptide repeat protein [Marinobacterium arenosum]|uniref:tetratricopeptide repeat protein n=1 Tax=Marinobacterium arenosum TaxID=2862496 RepID=UPI001C95027D|nr:tetratricopeptide repeat protein [Marinobacterium arenosum]MBY4676531.1 tetratricopeptide repeat protein [Marinobacterium arenosum]